MAEFDKENIADGLLVEPRGTKAAAPSPKKSTSKKSRSKSIGPGGLEEVPLKEAASAGNRRKSAFPVVKSILSTNEEDVKARREARRKSLANRRVSFAPEATLHTWDVIEYMRDATTSSASSESTRRASSVSQSSSVQSPRSDVASSDPAEPPSTPPEHVEESKSQPGSSPANQCDIRQIKKRRSSGIPPMNFNNPDDDFSSSPISGNSSTDGSDDAEGGSDGEDGGSTMMSIDAENDTQRTSASVQSVNSSGSSARLDDALRLASRQAGTQRFDFDEDGDMSMEMADDEVTAAFKPFLQKSAQPLRGAEENPFFSANEPNSPATTVDDDMSMDVTRALGGIVRAQENGSPLVEDETMEFTTALGNIRENGPKASQNRRASLKRRRSAVDIEQSAHTQGSPAKRRQSVRRRRSSVEDSSAIGEETMDLTTAVGGIKEKAFQQENRSASVDTSFGEETMEFTMAMGGIRDLDAEKGHLDPDVEDDEGLDANEDLSMEFTNVFGGIKRSAVFQPSDNAATPVKIPSPPSRDADRHTIIVPSPEKPAPTQERTESISQSRTPPKPLRRSSRRSLVPATPEAQTSPAKSAKSAAEPSPLPLHNARSKDEFKIATPQTTTPKDEPGPSTPVAKPDLDVVQDTPERVTEKHQQTEQSDSGSVTASQLEAPVFKSSSALADSIKLLSTPRKQVPKSPMKRAVVSTPKEATLKIITPQVSSPKATTPKQSPTPRRKSPRKSLSPKKSVRIAGSPLKQVENADDVQEELEEDQPEVEQIELRDFLNLTGIRFMDISTTKRRHTVAPSLDQRRSLDSLATDDSFENCVVAAACVVPEYSMYRHACRELKSYIAGGKDAVLQIEEEVREENPALFSEYLAAPPDQRHVMDNQFKNLKTHARLKSKELWYGWRSTLLDNLKTALLETGEEFNLDEADLAKQEKKLDAALPELIVRHESLSAEAKQLQQRADELSSCDREELEAARDRLISVDSEIEEKKRLIESLEKELQQKESAITATQERKITCAKQIKAAEQIREECRGWSVSEVNTLQDKVDALERTYGWSITSASQTSATLTMTYLSDLELYFHPASFGTGSSTQQNSRISLMYIGDVAIPHPRPLTTTKRFFLQLLRAHLQCMPQATTSVRELLGTVGRTWDKAKAVAEGVRRLNLEYITVESIVGDESMCISSVLLLPTLSTKVKVYFDIGASVTGEKDGVNVDVGVRAEVLYGEQLKEDRMGKFLMENVGRGVRPAKEMGVWSDAVGELKKRLIARGKKEKV